MPTWNTVLGSEKNKRVDKIESLCILKTPTDSMESSVPQFKGRFIPISAWLGLDWEGKKKSFISFSRPSLKNFSENTGPHQDSARPGTGHHACGTQVQLDPSLVAWNQKDPINHWETVCLSHSPVRHLLTTTLIEYEPLLSTLQAAYRTAKHLRFQHHLSGKAKLVCRTKNPKHKVGLSFLEKDKRKMNGTSHWLCLGQRHSVPYKLSCRSPPFGGRDSEVVEQGEIKMSAAAKT